MARSHMPTPAQLPQRSRHKKTTAQRSRKNVRASHATRAGRSAQRCPYGFDTGTAVTVLRNPRHPAHRRKVVDPDGMMRYVPVAGLVLEISHSRVSKRVRDTYTGQDLVELSDGSRYVPATGLNSTDGTTMIVPSAAD